MADSLQLHASCIAINSKAVLILGESGSGKSDLALRLIDSGAKLVGDDQIVLTSPSLLEGEGRGGGQKSTKTTLSSPLPTPLPQGKREIIASPAAKLEGLLEVRGVGIMKLPYEMKVPVALTLKLVNANEVERLPEPQFFDCLGLQLPLLSLYAFDHSTPAKIRLFLSTSRLV